MTGALVFVFWAQANSLAFAAAMFVHGSIGSFFTGTAPHELGHRTVFRSKALNRIFLYIFSLLSWWNPFDYASCDTYHRLYTLHPDGDRENLLPLYPSTGKLFILQILTINLLTPPGRTFGKGGLLSTVWETVFHARDRVGSVNIASGEWLNALHEDQPAEHCRTILWSLILLAFHGVVFVQVLFLELWVLPAIFSAIWLAYLLGLPQHFWIARECS